MVAGLLQLVEEETAFWLMTLILEKLDFKSLVGHEMNKLGLLMY